MCTLVMPKGTLSDDEAGLFQSGVCGNETFHREIKNISSGVSMHLAVLDMKLQYIQMRKLLAHNSALYHTTVRQMEASEMVSRRIPSIDPWAAPNSWSDWCPDLFVNVRGAIPAQRGETCITIGTSEYMA